MPLILKEKLWPALMPPVSSLNGGLFFNWAHSMPWGVRVAFRFKAVLAVLRFEMIDPEMLASS